ncbi:hypothetical protein DPX16_5315 [Anabarilius grahami]|uniref:Uncharacterized protein n=1 Tax=Anabarilius grahami TaxID=495550 RepID=A0A3N0XU35_ANAGA|nr:hypothetical protein DPX16_5315 [Anabarilius grahami]
MIRWPNGPTSSDADSTCRIGRKKANEDQLQPMVQNTLRKLSRPTNKNCPTADCRLDQLDLFFFKRPPPISVTPGDERTLPSFFSPLPSSPLAG